MAMEEIRHITLQVGNGRAWQLRRVKEALRVETYERYYAIT